MIKKWMRWLFCPWTSDQSAGRRLNVDATPDSYLFARDTQCFTVGDMVYIRHQIGDHKFPFHYRADLYLEAARCPGRIAAERGLFTWRDAAAVTEMMRKAHIMRLMMAGPHAVKH